MKVMVLAGGPDRERPISLKSGAAVVGALREAGHEVRQRDIQPNDLSALDECMAWGADGVFPVLHGSWGEGGPLQRILDQRGIPYVGSGACAADRCMDKQEAKLVLARHGLPTPPFEMVPAGHPITLEPPIVLKAPREGSSIDVAICHNAGAVSVARQRLGHQPMLLVERFVAGTELTVSVLADCDGPRALPPVRIVPATGHYDYHAKYDRGDTRYVLDPTKIGLSASMMVRLGQLAIEAHRVLGCRHLSRVDFIVDASSQPWILEVNTMPGFTDHSLWPMAGAYAGLSLPVLADRLVQAAFAVG